jgi:hypothetical protein
MWPAKIHIYLQAQAAAQTAAGLHNSLATNYIKEYAINIISQPQS